MHIVLSWLAMVVSFLIFAFVTLFLMTRGSHKMKVVYSPILFAIAVIGGFIFYSHGYLAPGTGILEAGAAALRGIFSTTRMFLVNADYNILLTKPTWLQIVFWACHVSALLLINAALFTLLGRRLTETFRLYFGWHSEVYIIKGSANYVLMLGENIATNDNPQNPPNKKRVVVLLLDDEDDAKKIVGKANHFGGIVRAVDRKYGLIYYLKMAGLGSDIVINLFGKELNISRHLRVVGIGKMIWPERDYNVVLMPNNTSAPDDARSVAEYAEKKKVDGEKLEIFVFASSQWAREEIESFTQHDDHKYPCVFHIINETDLLIRRMIEKHPPCKCRGLEFDGQGVAKRNFNVMVLGFGTVGEQALLRLIMNGQFVTHNKSRMCAVVVDKEKDHLEEHFRHCYPSLELCCETHFLDYDVRNKKFFDLLKNEPVDEKLDNKNRIMSIVNNLDYVVVALHNNEENKRIALDIQLLYQRKGLENRPIIAVLEKDEGVHEIEHGGGIFIFGSREKIYKDSVIIREDVNKMAQAVNDTYNKMHGSGDPWHNLNWFGQESNRAQADFIPAMLKLADCTAEEAISKGKLIEDATLAVNLAKTEHLRWMAFHVAMGYRPITVDEMQQRFERYKNDADPLKRSRKDEKARLHVCLAPWDELDKISEAYNELGRRAGKMLDEDFKKTDSNIIENIPMFLEAAKAGDVK
jgi:hypothetical protein